MKKMFDQHAMLGLYIISITAFMDIMLLLKGLPTGVDSTISGMILGGWNVLAGTVVNWAFGSSRSGDRQTELLAQTTPSVTPNAAQTAADTEKKP